MIWNKQKVNTCTLTVQVKTIDKQQHHYQVIVPFSSGIVTFEYYDDLFGFDHYNRFIEMIKNYLKPDNIKVINR